MRLPKVASGPEKKRIADYKPIELEPGPEPVESQLAEQPDEDNKVASPLVMPVKPPPAGATLKGGRLKKDSSKD